MSMATQEFYIRTASETEAHGPFTQEQLVSLAEAGKVDPQTLYYEASTEQWISISNNAELKAAIFPEKQKLTIKPKANITTLNEGPDTNPPITVDDMLAAAEGRTAETRDKRDKNIAFERAAKIGRYAAIFMMLISCAALLSPSIDLLSQANYDRLIWEPFAYLGLIDLGIAILLLLGAISTYPFLRFRAIFGIGLIGTILWGQGFQVQVLAVTAGYLGLWFTTVFVSYMALGVAIGVGMAGLLGFAYFMLSN